MLGDGFVVLVVVFAMGLIWWSLGGAAEFLSVWTSLFMFVAGAVAAWGFERES